MNEICGCKAKYVSWLYGQYKSVLRNPCRIQNIFSYGFMKWASHCQIRPEMLCRIHQTMTQLCGPPDVVIIHVFWCKRFSLSKAVATYMPLSSIRFSVNQNKKSMPFLGHLTSHRGTNNYIRREVAIWFMSHDPQHSDKRKYWVMFGIFQISCAI